MDSLLSSFDARISAVLADWSLATTVLALVLTAVFIYPLIYPNEPDTHPLLLARQASVSAIRHKGESAIYRSPESSHGYPLRTGLNVKDPSGPRWAAGRNGDLRDVWREVLLGGSSVPDLTGRPSEIPRGCILSVFGKEEIIEHDLDTLSKEIGVIGNHLKDAGLKKIGVYLPNCVEYLELIFACSFYGLSPVLLPFNLPPAKLYQLLNDTGVDALVAQAGTVPLEDVAAEVRGLRALTWVVEKTSRHMDWNGVPDSAQGRLSVSVWHDVVEENIKTSVELLNNDSGYTPGDIITVWQPTDLHAKPEIVSFTQENIIAAVSATISAIPLRQRFTAADLVLPADIFAHSYVLCQTLAALYTHASVVINSVAMAGVELDLARRGVAPTVVIASAETLLKYHEQQASSTSSSLQRLGKYSQSQAFAAGRMPTDGLLFRLLAPSSSSKEPGRLRLILVSERAGAGSPPLTSAMLSDLRVSTRSRIIYALTAARVAGAVAQTNVFDYRQDGSTKAAHFGIPLSSVEVKLVGRNDAEVAGQEPQGEILVSGPAVSGGQVRLAQRGRIREDFTIAYA